MVARFFILNTKRIGIFCGDSTAVKESSALVQIEARENNGLWQPRVVPAIPERIGEAHRMWQAESEATSSSSGL